VEGVGWRGTASMLTWRASVPMYIVLTGRPLSRSFSFFYSFFLNDDVNHIDGTASVTVLFLSFFSMSM